MSPFLDDSDGIADAPAALTAPALDLSALPSGTRFGEMEILRVLAVGGFGIVYLARDHSLDRDVAIKEFMPAQLVYRNQGQRVTVRSICNADTFALALQSFVNEAKLLARFTHPAMVKVYRFWEANGTGYMVMPYLRGPTLSDVRRSISGPPTETWLRSVIDPLLDALAMLHAEGLYHRDIAPDNVVWSDAGHPVLLDFGAARRVIGDRSQSVTAILKPRYAPIEQYAESTQLRQGPWTDLYALAALTVYLLDGVPPPASTARSIHDDQDVLAKRRIPGVSPCFLAAIDWALAVRPQDRPQSVAQLRAALKGQLVPPLTHRAHPLAPQGRAMAVPSSVTDVFPKTAQQVPTDAPPAPARTSAVPGRRFAPEPRLVALASVLVLVVLFAPRSWLAQADTAVASTQLSAPRTTAPFVAAPSGVALPTALGVRAAAVRVAGAPSVKPAAAQPAILLAGAQSLAPGGAATTIPLGSPVGEKAEKQPGKYAAQSRKLAKASASRPGPIEMCADHSFFVRPFCMQRRCDTPRFKAHAQCVQLRQQVAQYHTPGR